MITDRIQSEKYLMRLACEGDENALGDIVDLHAPALITYLSRLVNDSHQAEDLAQETFLRAFDYLNKFDHSRPFRPWLFKIGRNLALNYLSSRTGRERRESDDISERPDLATTGGPEEVLQMNERRAGISKILSLLPMHFREVLHLKYIDGFEYQAIAVTLDLPIGTVRTWLHRAKKEFLDKAATSGFEFDLE